MNCKKCGYELKSGDIAGVCVNEHLICVECLVKLKGTKCEFCNKELNDIIFK